MTGLLVSETAPTGTDQQSNWLRGNAASLWRN